MGIGQYDCSNIPAASGGKSLNKGAFFQKGMAFITQPKTKSHARKRDSVNQVMVLV